MFHVIYRQNDGWMWQSYTQDTATPLPDGYTQPDGYAIASFVEPPSRGTVWDPAKLSFVTPTVPATLKATMLEFFGAQRLNDVLLPLYPLALPALDAENWPVFRALMDRARDEASIKVEEHAAISGMIP